MEGQLLSATLAFDMPAMKLKCQELRPNLEHATGTFFHLQQTVMGLLLVHL